ncbi:MAG TPA: iron ABC transporter permease [Usitatibacter sp.]|nr:iron ABC transporter permease [Usitatibacter sp.]
MRTVEAARASVRARWPDRGAVVQWAVAAFTVALVLTPIVPVVLQSLMGRALYDGIGSFTARNYAGLVTSRTVLEAVGNSLVFGVLTTVIALVIGGGAAIAIGRTDMPGAKLFGELLLWPLYLSQLVMAFGFSIMYGPSGYVTLAAQAALGGHTPWSLYTLLGMAVVAAICEAPVTFLYCLNATRMADASLENAARVSGAGPLATLWHVTVPLMRPALVYSAMLNFTLALELLSVPLVFGSPVGIHFLSTFLYDEGIGASTPNYGLVGAAAVALLAIVTLLVWLQGRLLTNIGRFITVRGKATRPGRFPLGWLRWPVAALFALYAVFGVLAPLTGLALRGVTSFLTPLVPLWEVWTTQHLRMIVSSESYVRSVVNSVAISLFGGALATALVALVAIVTQRSPFRHARALEFVALYPRAVPGLVVGLGFLWAMIVFPPLGVLHNTIAILVIAFTMRYLPTGLGAVSPALLQVSPELDRAARVSGADWWTTSWAVSLRLLKPALFSAFALLFICFFKDYATAVFLFAPGSEVIGTTLLTFWIQGDTGPVAALAMVQVLLTFVFVYGVRFAFGVRVYG